VNDCLLCGSSAAAPLFESSDRLYGTTTARFQVVRCGECGLLRLHPQPSPEEVGRYYPADYWFAPEPGAAGRLAEGYRRLVLRDHVRFVARALETSGARGPLVDVGSGGGLFVRLMRDRGVSAFGFDFSPGAAAIACKRQGVPAVCGLLPQAPLRPGAFAAVTMFHVLEHLHDPGAYLRAARQLLAPEGRLIVQVPNAGSWQFRLLGRRWNGVDVPRHLFDFRERDLVRLLDACGFQVVRRKHFSLRDNPAGLASSLAPWLDPMARRVRRLPESAAARVLKDALYFALTAAALPFAAAEAASGAGASIMIEARAK
jgi:SAM-dependent methyltransferase